MLTSSIPQWEADDETIEKLKSLYADADDMVEQVASSFG